MAEPGPDSRFNRDPTAAGFVPILSVILVLFAAIGVIVTKPGERVVAFAVVGVALVLLLLVLAWEVLGRRNGRLS